MSEHKSANIALSGVKGSGKSTVSEFLVDMGYQEETFAGPIKRLVIDIFQIDEKYCYDPAWKEVVIDELGVSGRQLMQVIGTEIGRNALAKHLPNIKLRGGNLWIHSLMKRVERATRPVVVSDVRFEDESQIVKALGFTVWKISRPSLEKNSTSNHASEAGCSYDVEIVNDGTIGDLYDKVMKLM
jgi:hypothetical protein